MDDRKIRPRPQPTAAERAQREALRCVIEFILESKTPTAWYLRHWLFSQYWQPPE